MNQDEASSSNQCVEEVALNLDGLSTNIFQEKEERHVMNKIAGFTPSQDRDTENGTPALSSEIQSCSMHPNTALLLSRQQGRRVDEP